MDQSFWDNFCETAELIAIPLILASLVKGISDLKDISKFKNIGLKTMSIYIGTTVIAITIGLLLVNVLKPGDRISEGTILEKPLLEYYYKNDELGDPIISKEHIYSFEWAKKSEIETIDQMTMRINDILQGIFRGIGIKLVDFKIEYGRVWNKEKEINEIVLADEISPDTCRLWDIKTEKKLDKDRFRKDLGNIIEAYQEVARRLNIMPEETNISEVNFGKTIPLKFKKK